LRSHSIRISPTESKGRERDWKQDTFDYLIQQQNEKIISDCTLQCLPFSPAPNKNINSGPTFVFVVGKLEKEQKHQKEKIEKRIQSETIFGCTGST
jgi:hypothetical protein